MKRVVLYFIPDMDVGCACADEGLRPLFEGIFSGNRFEITCNDISVRDGCLVLKFDHEMFPDMPSEMYFVLRYLVRYDVHDI